MAIEQCTFSQSSAPITTFNVSGVSEFFTAGLIYVLHFEIQEEGTKKYVQSRERGILFPLNNFS
jgi:hypothetical protein